MMMAVLTMLLVLETWALVSWWQWGVVRLSGGWCLSENGSRWVIKILLGGIGVTGLVNMLEIAIAE